MTETFTLYWWDPEGNYHKERTLLGAKEAVELAHSFTTTRPAARMGMIHKVMLTDAFDMTVFLWEKDKGVIFPELKGGNSSTG